MQPAFRPHAPLSLLLAPLALAIGVAGPPPALADAAAPDPSLAPKIVDALQALGGPKAGLRKAHPKGVCFAGSFTADPASAAQVTSAAAYNAAAPYPVIGRFSMAGPNPKAADNAKEGRGLAVHLSANADSRTDLVLTSTPMFPAANPQDFLELLRALGPDPATGKPDPAALPAYLKTHPAPGRVRAWLDAHPVYASYATTPWFGIHAFAFTNAQGKTIQGKIVAHAAGGDQGLDEAAAKALGPDFLSDELGTRLAKGPARIEVAVQVGEAGDPTNDPSQPWPDQRRSVHLGTLSIDRLTGQDCAGEMFLPTTLDAGIDLIDDPLLPVRAAAYAVSYGRRQSGQ